MQNLLVFKVKSEERRMKNSNAAYANDKTLIDSILRTNMPGETDSMYMEIPVLSERGLWEMKGDAMGGPYVMHRIHKPTSQAEIQQGYDLYIIGFVYAPEMKKENINQAARSCDFYYKISINGQQENQGGYHPRRYQWYRI